MTTEDLPTPLDTVRELKTELESKIAELLNVFSKRAGVSDVDLEITRAREYGRRGVVEFFVKATIRV